MRPTPLTTPLESGPDPEVQIILVLGILAGLVLVFVGFRTYKVGRLIKNTPTEKVRSAAVGRTELFGTSVPKEHVFDRPFTDGQCLYAKYKVEEYREYDDDDKDDEWVTLFSKTLAAPFYLDDGTGRMLVDADSNTTFEIGGKNSYKKTVKKRRSPPQKVQEFLRGPATGSDSRGSTTTGQTTGSGGGRMEQVPDVEQTEQASGEFLEGLDGVDSDVTYITRGDLNRKGAILDQADDEGEDDQSEDASQLESTGEDDESSGLLGKVSGAVSSVSEAVSSMSGPRAVSPTSRRKRRYTQEVLPVGEDTYVFGAAEPRDADVSAANEDRLVMTTDIATGKFIISDRGEEKIAWGYTKRALIFLIAGLVLSAGSLGILAHLLGF